MGNWSPPAEGKMEFDIITLTSLEPVACLDVHPIICVSSGVSCFSDRSMQGQTPMNEEELRMLTRLLESTSSDMAKLHYLKQACLTYVCVWLHSGTPINCITFSPEISDASSRVLR